MEMIKIPKEEYKNMIKELKLLRSLKDIDWDLVNQFKKGLDDVKVGKIRKVA